jgi:hypothetical protein
MKSEKYNTNALAISAILGLIQSKEIAIPEIQRPFVWKRTQVRDLLDSLFRGYPTGYLILWKNPDIKLKDGTLSSGKKILIDGQQRVTALMTAIAGIPVVNADYKTERIKIAFNPFAILDETGDKPVFEVQDQSHLKDKRWIPDVSEVFKSGFNFFDFVMKYCALNPDMPQNKMGDIVSRLTDIGNRQIGVIELSDRLGIDVVTDIFIRINSKGTALSQGDFVMSKIAADEAHEGNALRKLIDYYSHLSVEPSFYNQILQNDKEFANSPYLGKIAWLRNETESVYDPTCDDVLRVAFMTKFPRARLADLVSLLSGRDFETREYREEVVAETYAKLSEGVLESVNENRFKQFMLTIRGAGFVSPKLVNSNLALDFAYTLFLRLSHSCEVPPSEIKRIVQRWYVLSVLTGRYSSSPESAFYRDLLRIREAGAQQAFSDLESAIVSENFWVNTVPQNLSYAVSSNPTYQVFVAAQITAKDISLLSNNISVADLVTIQGDVHHVFPKEYLKANGFERSKFNQLANYVYLDTQVNKSIGKRAPRDYFAEAFRQCETKVPVCGTIIDVEVLKKNLSDNCIPEAIVDMDCASYGEFLDLRRKLMAAKIRRYYEKL